jgi:hypothetical protein
MVELADGRVSLSRVRESKKEYLSMVFPDPAVAHILLKFGRKIVDAHTFHEATGTSQVHISIL